MYGQAFGGRLKQQRPVVIRYYNNVMPRAYVVVASSRFRVTVWPPTTPHAAQPSPRVSASKIYCRIQ